ncbi:MAG TPA: HEPN domain-containing protein [Thermoplasmata archaeon]|nr:HEPN domain-containing protein [Thermoplasmata archaeon]
MRPEAELWWTQSKRDYRTAKNCHASRDHYAAVFFSQQAVEKALKAAVVEVARELPPRTHNLVQLGEQLRAPTRIRAFLMDLTPEYVITRYPDAAGGPIDDLYDGRISRRVLTRTQEVLQWVGRRLRP